MDNPDDNFVFLKAWLEAAAKLTDDKFVFSQEWLEAVAKVAADDKFKKPKTFRIICHPDDKELYERILRVKDRVM